MQFIPCLLQNPQLRLVNYDISVQQTVAMDSIISGSDTNFKWLFYIEVLIPLVSSCVISRVGYCLFNNCIPALKRKFWVQNNKRETFVISLKSWSAETGCWQVMLKALCVHGLNNMEFYSYLLRSTRKQVRETERKSRNLWAEDLQVLWAQAGYLVGRGPCKIWTWNE